MHTPGAVSHAVVALIGQFGNAFIVPKGNPKKLQTYEDIKKAGATMVAPTGYVMVKEARKVGIVEDKIMKVPGTTEVLAAVRSGRADIGAMTAVEANKIAADTRRIRSKIGMCFQHFNLFPHMTALGNCMEGPVQVLKLSRKEAEERSLELLEMVGMADKRDEHPSRLSGGQQQRVAIARALAMRPKIMLFDEVTSALDPEVISEVTNVIRELVNAHNLTMLMVTHQMGFAREISDRVCFFYNGSIEEQGPPTKLFEAPERNRTQQFLNAVLDAN